MTPEEDAARSAAAVVEARMQDLAIHQRELSRISGVSVATIRRLQKGEPYPFRPDRLGKLSKALGWPTGRISDLLAGRAPSGEEDDEVDDEDNALLSRVEQLQAGLASLENGVLELRQEVRGLRDAVEGALRDRTVGE